MSKQMSRGARQAACQDGNDELGTPPKIIRRLHEALGDKFELDVAAGAENIEIAHRRFTVKDNGLAQPWNAETVYLNPPYSDPLPWMQRTVDQLSRDHGPSLVIALLKSDVSPEWFQDYATEAEYLCAVGERLSFVGADGSAPFGSIMLAFTDDETSVSPDIIEAFDEFGAVYRRETVTEASKQARLTDIVNDGGVRAAPASPASPAQPGCGISLDRLTPRDEVTLSFRTQTLGAIGTLPDSATVRMLPGGRDFDPEIGQITVDCLGPGALPTGGDLYVQIREYAYGATPIEVAVSVDGEPWELAPVESADKTTPTPGSQRPPVEQYLHDTLADKLAETTGQ